MVYRHLDELHAEWEKRSAQIERRLADFRRVGKGTDDQLFAELAFCLFAIQTSARRADAAVRALTESERLWRGSPAEIALVLRRHVRFHNHKAAYLVGARERFLAASYSLHATLDSFPTIRDAREWLVREVEGFGYKEASHFLRNVGRGEDLAILDRHVLRNLRYHRVIARIPDSMSRVRYLTIEEKVRAFSKAVRIPMAAVDLLFWSRETGEVFK